jgi:hypothetical protein
MFGFSIALGELSRRLSVLRFVSPPITRAMYPRAAPSRCVRPTSPSPLPGVYFQLELDPRHLLGSSENVAQVSRLLELLGERKAENLRLQGLSLEQLDPRPKSMCSANISFAATWSLFST